MSHCKHGTYVGDWAGPDYICGACEDGLCVHHKHVSGFAWEDTEGCEACGIPPRARTVASLAEAGRLSFLRMIVTSNPRASIHRLASPHHMNESDLVVMVAARIEHDAWLTSEGR